MATRTGGIGTTRMVLGRCLRPRASCGLPVLVQAVPVRGQAAVRIIFPRPCAGLAIVDGLTLTAAVGARHCIRLAGLAASSLGSTA